MKLQIDTEEKTIKILQNEVNIHEIYVYLQKILGDELPDYKLILNNTPDLVYKLKDNTTLPWVTPSDIINPGPTF